MKDKHPEIDTHPAVSYVKPASKLADKLRLRRRKNLADPDLTLTRTEVGQINGEVAIARTAREGYIYKARANFPVPTERFFAAMEHMSQWHRCTSLHDVEAFITEQESRVYGQAPRGEVMRKPALILGFAALVVAVLLSPQISVGMIVSYGIALSCATFLAVHHLLPTGGARLRITGHDLGAGIGVVSADSSVWPLAVEIDQSIAGLLERSTQTREHIGHDGDALRDYRDTTLARLDDLGDQYDRLHQLHADVPEELTARHETLIRDVSGDIADLITGVRDLVARADTFDAEVARFSGPVDGAVERGNKADRAVSDIYDITARRSSPKKNGTP